MPAIRASQNIGSRPSVTRPEHRPAHGANHLIERRGNVCASVESLGRGADLPTDRLPFRIVPVSVPGQGVGDLVQNRVADVALVIDLHVVRRQRDGLCAFLAVTELPLAARKAERPRLQAMAVHQFTGQLFSFAEFHAESLTGDRVENRSDRREAKGARGNYWARPSAGESPERECRWLPDVQPRPGPIRATR